MKNALSKNDDIDELSQRVIGIYPQLADIKGIEWRDALYHSQAISVPADSVIVASDQVCTSFVMLLSGCVRVYQPCKDGREVTIYRVSPGDVCVLSIQGLLNGESPAVVAEAETDITGIGLRADDFHQLLAHSDVFRRFTMGQLATRLLDVMHIVQDTTFQRLNVRLSSLLLDMFTSSRSDVLQITHHDIARELGTTREVISRILKRFELQNCIRLARGTLHLISKQQLIKQSLIQEKS